MPACGTSAIEAAQRRGIICTFQYPRILLKIKYRPREETATSVGCQLAIIIEPRGFSSSTEDRYIHHIMSPKVYSTLSKGRGSNEMGHSNSNILPGDTK